MPINEKGEVWRKSRLSSGVECQLTKEFFISQSDLEFRVSEYNNCVWKPRNNIDGKSSTWKNAMAAETKALDIIRDKFHSVLTHNIINKAHQSILPLKELVEMVSRNCEQLIKGEEVKMEKGDDIILACKVVKVHSDDSSYTINDGTRDIIRVPSTHLRRLHSLTCFDIESLIRITCTQSGKDNSWQVDDVYKKEFGMKEKLAPIFCKNRRRNEAIWSEDDEVIVLPPEKKTEIESNESLKENGGKKEVKKENDEKEMKKARKRKNNNEKKEEVEKKKPKKVTKEMEINLDSTDDDTPLSVITKKKKNTKQKQGFLDTFLKSSPSSKRGGSPSKKGKGRVEKAVEPLMVLYKKEDYASFLQHCDTLAKELTKDQMDARIEIIKMMDTEEANDEAEILHIIQWRKQTHILHSQVMKLGKEERGAAREMNKKELEIMDGKISFDKMKEKIKVSKAMKEIEEDVRIGYDRDMGKLSPSGDIIHSSNFPTALMISEFIFTRSNIFPSNYRIPMTEEIDDALNASGMNKSVKSRKVTYPIVKNMLDMLTNDGRFQRRYVFCNCSIAKLKFDEYSIIEIIRSILTGERLSTKEERLKWKEEMMETKKEENDEDRPRSPEDVNDEEEEERDVTINEEDRVELVEALDHCNGRWEEIDGKSQGAIIEFLINCYIDSDLFEIKTNIEVEEEYDELKKEKRKLKATMVETRNLVKELKGHMEKKEMSGLRLARAETGKALEMEEKVNKIEKRMDEVTTMMKNVVKELSLSKYGARVDPIGMDRHGRRYMLMPHYAGLLIQSIGSEEWIKNDDGNEEFGYVPSHEEWRSVNSEKEWNELSEKLKNGSRREKKLMKGMEKNKENFMNGLEWKEKIEANLKNNEEEVEKEIKLNQMEVIREEMMSMLEKSENGELLKVKDISTFNKRMKEANSLENWRSILLDFEGKLKCKVLEEQTNSLHRLFKYKIRHSSEIWRERVEGARISELILLLRVLDYQTVWNYKEVYREKEEKKKEKDEEDEWMDKGVHTRKFVGAKDKKEVGELMRKVMGLATGRLLSTLNTLESDDERLMNMKDIEEECHRYSLDKLKKVLRKNVDRWREEIENRFVHRLGQFDLFSDAVFELI